MKITFPSPQSGNNVIIEWAGMMERGVSTGGGITKMSNLDGESEHADTSNYPLLAS